jgi:hypothetical protein
MKSRKLIAWIVGGTWLTINLLAIYVFKPTSDYVPIVLMSIGAFIFLTCVYIGGTVYKDWIKSKHFRPEFFNGKNE